MQKSQSLDLDKMLSLNPQEPAHDSQLWGLHPTAVSREDKTFNRSAFMRIDPIWR